MTRLKQSLLALIDDPSKGNTILERLGSREGENIRKTICDTHLKPQQLANGAFVASLHSTPTHNYHKTIRFRDCMYESIGLESVGDNEGVRKAYDALFDVLYNQKELIEKAIKTRPIEDMQYIHARYYPNSLQADLLPWPNRQNDFIGKFLYEVVRLHKKQILPLDDVRRDMLQNLVDYLISIEYWHDNDHGTWEQAPLTIKSSSVGICVAGLSAAKTASLVVPNVIISKGLQTLRETVPNESNGPGKEERPVDLAQLKLVTLETEEVLTFAQQKAILERVERSLIDYDSQGKIVSKGLKRHNQDHYDRHRDGTLAEYPLGFAWLAQIYKRKDPEKYEMYLKKSIEACQENMEMPELYYKDEGNGQIYANLDSPFGWGTAMLLAALNPHF